MTKDLNKFELASIKRTYNSVKRLYTKRDKLLAVIEAKQAELALLMNEIEDWEAPVVKKYGMTSEQILNAEVETPEEFKEVFDDPVVTVTPDPTMCEEDVIPAEPAMVSNDSPWN